MKIALCVPSLPLCGIGTSVGIIRSGLLKAGHEVDVIVTSGYPGSDYESAQIEGWSIRCYGQGVRFLRERLRIVLERLNHYDVIINNHSIEMQLIAPCLSSQILRVSVARSLNDVAMEQVSLGSRYFDAAVAISWEMERVMKETPGIQCPVYMIPNCTDARCDRFVELDVPVKIAYIGWLRQQDKNALVLPEIAACLHKRGVEFRLKIVGDGPDRRAIEDRMHKVDWQSSVTMVGQIPRGEARDILRESHFTLIPSHYEGLSNVMLESMALGSVPIASDLENFRGVLGDVAAELQVPVNDADRYAERIAMLAANPSEYHRIQAYLHDRQRAMFTPQVTVNGYLTLIDRLKVIRSHGTIAPIPFDRLLLPGRYKHQCTVWWRCLQMARDFMRQHADNPFRSREWSRRSRLT